MKGIRKAFRFVPVLLLGTAVCVGLSGCKQAGNGITDPEDPPPPGVPTPRATLATHADINPIAGGQFNIFATYRDASGTGVPGVKVTCDNDTLNLGSETITPFTSSPTLTAAAGLATILVQVHEKTPNGDFAIRCSTSAADQAATTESFLSVRVLSPSMITNVTLLPPLGSVTAGAGAQFKVEATIPAGCTPEYQFDYGAGYGASDADGYDTHIFTTPGSYRCSARVRCGGASASSSLSKPSSRTRTSSRLRPSSPATSSSRVKPFFSAASTSQLLDSSWVESDEVQVTVQESVLPLVSDVTLVPPAGVITGSAVYFQVTATIPNGCTPEYQFSYGAGFGSTDADGFEKHTFLTAGDYISSARARCVTFPESAWVTSPLVTVSVTDPVGPVISDVVLVPPGGMLTTGSSYTFQITATIPSGCSPVYEFNFGTGFSTDTGTPAFENKTFSSAGIYQTSGRVKCSGYPTWYTSALVPVTVADPVGPAISNVLLVPPAGTLKTGTSYVFQITATIPAGCTPIYEFNFGAGFVADSVANGTAFEPKSFTTAGTYQTSGRVHCTGYPTLYMSAIVPVTITDDVGPTIGSVTLVPPAGTLTTGTSYSFQITATIPVGCTPVYQFNFGSGFGSDNFTGFQTHSFNPAGSYNTSGRVKCLGYSTWYTSGIVPVTVANPGEPSVSNVVLVQPGGTLKTGSSYTFQITGTIPAGCTPVYQFNFGAGFVADSGTPAFEDHSFGAAGTYQTSGRVQCTGYSTWFTSPIVPVTVADDVGPTVSNVVFVPPVGPVTTGSSNTFQITATIPAGCTPVYQFNFGAGFVADSGTPAFEDHSFSAVGTYQTSGRVQCSGYSTWYTSALAPVTVVDPAPSNVVLVPPGGTVTTLVSANFAITATIPAGCTPVYQFNYGSGFGGDNLSGFDIHTFTTAGTYQTSGRAQCSGSSTWTTSSLVPVTVEDSAKAIVTTVALTAPNETVLASETAYFVASATLENGNCTPVYQFNVGAGWVDDTSPGHYSTSFLVPNTYLAQARAKCPSQTGYAYSEISEFKVSAVLFNSFVGPTQLILDGSSVSGNYATSVQSAPGCTPVFQINKGLGWGSNGNNNGNTDVDGFFTLSFTQNGVYQVQARVKCSGADDTAYEYSDFIAVTILAPETITTPVLTGNNAVDATLGPVSETYTATASSSFGDALEYKFDCDTGGGFGAWGAGSVTCTFDTTATKNVKVQARCATHNAVLSTITMLPVSVTGP